ncbi:hypothetical protein AC578_1757 [Pseudocercospora eumusae]|uniref:Uncharacterized protein n=1 Tax=Pseudocercospora eumusae TaxID=321146 RepID=A0A139H7K2_9PEZI|nr:hypothetical protein AC578_1757 [Pseudocercospora eumusae]
MRGECNSEYNNNSWDSVATVRPRPRIFQLSSDAHTERSLCIPLRDMGIEQIEHNYGAATTQYKTRYPLSTIIILLSSLVAGIFLGTTLSQAYRSEHNDDLTHSFGTFERGFVTEKILPAELYEIEHRRFTSSVGFHPDGTEFLIQDPSEPAYVGEPSPEIDQAWEEMVHNRYWSISESEAQSLWGVGYELYRDQVKGGYTGGFDSFHILHCLNMIRKRLSPEYYAGSMPHFGGVEHDMHCIDQIRQRLQCSAVGTAIPSRYSPEMKAMYVDSAQIHTCRKFENLLQYTRSRSPGGSLEVARVKWWEIET